MVLSLLLLSPIVLMFPKKSLVPVLYLPLCSLSTLCCHVSADWGAMAFCGGENILSCVQKWDVNCAACVVYKMCPQFHVKQLNSALPFLPALSVQSPGSDSWSKPVNTFNGTESSSAEVSGT